MKYKITVFTPTYNRAYILENLYNSLLIQEYKDFEWLIVDDGSTDNTKKIVDEWIKNKKINIRYYYQKNNGKHVAINNGVSKAKGELFFIVDSDDYITPNALEIINKYFNDIKNKKMYAGIGGLRVHENKNIIGTTFKGDYLDCTSLERKKNNINGDKAEVFYTKILKNYKFPVFEGENFLSEAYIWNKIANDGYKIRWVNEPFVFCEYLDDGLTKNRKSLSYRNIKGQLLYLKDLIKFETNIFRRIAHSSTYCFLSRKVYTKKEICNSININVIQYYLYIIVAYIRRWLNNVH